MYSDFELEVMLEDVRAFRDLDVRGFVVGILTKEGRVDIERMRKWVETLHFCRGFKFAPQTGLWMRFSLWKVR
jgi:copper homeostasis protein